MSHLNNNTDIKNYTKRFHHWPYCHYDIHSYFEGQPHIDRYSTDLFPEITYHHCYKCWGIKTNTQDQDHSAKYINAWAVYALASNKSLEDNFKDTREEPRPDTSYIAEDYIPQTILKHFWKEVACYLFQRNRSNLDPIQTNAHFDLTNILNYFPTPSTQWRFFFICLHSSLYVSGV